MSVCPLGYTPNHTRDLYHFLCVLPMSMARSSSGMLTIGRIAYRRERGDGTAQRGRSVIYDYLVLNLGFVHTGRSTLRCVALRGAARCVNVCGTLRNAAAYCGTLRRK